jgi:ABC-type lipoprotein release transport system permease subunit
MEPMSGWIDKQKNILDFTFSSILRRKGKNIAVLLVYILTVFLLASVMFLTYSIKKEATTILKDTPDLIVQKISAGRHEPIPLSYLEKVKQTRGISSVKGRLWGYYYDPVTGANYTLMVPEQFSHGPGGIEIGQGISRVRTTFPGDDLEFKTWEGKVLNLQVKKVFSPESELVSSDLILISEDDFRTLFGGSRDRVTDLVLRVKNPKEIPTIAGKIAELLPDTRIILREEILRTYDAVFSWRGGLLILILAGAVLAFIILSWDKASGLSQEEKKEIGILKAIGWETSDVILMKFWEGMTVSLSAFLAGILLAYVHVFFASSSIFEPVLKGWTVLYPQFRLVPFIDISQVVALFFLTVVPYTVATIIPSWRAATVDPDSVMRA